MIFSQGLARRVGIRGLALLLSMAGAGVAATAPSADPLPATLLAQFPDYDACPPEEAGGLRYVAARVDLDGDGKAETIVLMLGRESCGSGGCTAFVLRDAGTEYAVVTRITAVSTPIRASAKRSAGWRDLLVEVAGGGAEAGERVLRFDGKSYPDNASLAPPAAKDAHASLLIADAPMDRATLLVPSSCNKTKSVTATEALGGLSIGAPASAVEPLLGHPKTLSKPELWDGDGLYHRTWTFPSAGAVVGLSAPTALGPWKVFSVTLKGPGKKRTARGIGIGASRKQVLAAYGQAARPGEMQGRRTLLVGSDYGGLVFSLDKRDRVFQILLGSTAE